MNRILLTGACLVLASCLGGCSTLSGDFHQKLRIDAQDAQNRAIDGMQCTIGSGASAIPFVTPAAEVRVRRAMVSLQIECRRDALVATATVKSRRERMEEALLPFGSAGVFIDHLSGSLYSYPTALHLRVGQHVVLEHGGEAQVVTSEPLAPATAGAPQVELASVQQAAPADRAETGAAAAKSPAPAAPKADRAAARPAKAASAAAKPGADAPASAAPARTAPVNW